MYYQTTSVCILAHIYFPKAHVVETLLYAKMSILFFYDHSVYRLETLSFVLLTIICFEELVYVIFFIYTHASTYKLKISAADALKPIH